MNKFIRRTSGLAIASAISLASLFGYLYSDSLRAWLFGSKQVAQVTSPVSNPIAVDDATQLPRRAGTPEISRESNPDARQTPPGKKVASSAERQILLSASNYSLAWDQLSQLGTPRSKTMRAAIIEACLGGYEVDYTNARFWHTEIAFGKDIANRERVRKAVAERAPRVVCAGIPPSVLTHETSQKLLDQASAEGDSLARLRGLFHKVASEKVEGKVGGEVGNSPGFLQIPAYRYSASDVALLKENLLSGDPTAIWLALPLMYTTSMNEHFVLGNTPLSEAQLTPLADLLACDFGALCDATSNKAAEPCVLEGRCDFATVDDYYRSTYSRAEWEAVEHARAVLRDGILRGDLTALNLRPLESGQIHHGWAIPLRPYPFRIR